MELFMDLGLKEVANIIKSLGVSTNIMYLHGNVEVNGELYVYEKKGNQFTITSEHGRSVTVSINYSEETQEEFNRKVTYLKHEVLIDYKLANGEHLTFYRDIPLDRGYESFENVNRDDLINGVRNGVRPRYIDAGGNEVASFSVGLHKICFTGSKKIYEFTPEGIICGNRLITTDGGQLVSVSGVASPALQTVKGFDVDKEKGIIAKFKEEHPEAHEFTKQAMDDAMRLLDRKEREVKNVIDYYDQEIQEVRQALHVRNSIIDGVKYGAINPEAIDKAGNALWATIVAKRQKEQAEQRRFEQEAKGSFGL